MKKLFSFAVALLFATSLSAEDLRLVTENTGNSFPIVTSTGKASVVYDGNDADVVSTVCGMFVSDVKAVTGQTLQLKHVVGTTGSSPIIVGTIGKSRFVDSLVSAGKVDVSAIKGRWEAYSLQVVSNPYTGVDKALVVMGSDPRGTAYGLLYVSKLMGVSPFIWWADVAPTPKSTVCLSGDSHTDDGPDVKYRGMFINDEDWGLLPWAKKGVDKSYGSIGPNTYRRVADLMLRLRCNTLWPALHGSSIAFWALNENLKVARDYALIMSSGNPLLRDNLWEWPRFGGNSKNYNYKTNKAMMLDYWAKRVGQSRGYEAIYDISTRGFQDEPLLGYSNDEEAIEGITGLIADQRQLLRDSLGDPATIPQIYMPYKEALTLYNKGLKIPDDVTLCWVDDNFGYIRQLPTKEEQARSGGNGVYYHLSYLGTPAPYLWLSTMSPSFLSYELTKGYDNGIQRFWMFNVGDIKPCEEEFQFCMDLAWDVNAWRPENAWKYSRQWAAETFGESLADDISAIKLEYYDLASASKPELINRMDFTNNEYNQRMARYDELERKVEAVKTRVPSSLQDAFYELIEYPVKGCAEMNRKIIRSKQSWYYAAAGMVDSTQTCYTDAYNGYRLTHELTDKYNTGIADGKWHDMMSYSPSGGMSSMVFEQQVSAGTSDVFPVKTSVWNPDRSYYLAKDFTSSSGSLTEVKHMGVAGSCMVVSPADNTAYTETNYASAPSLTYKIRVVRGLNRIAIRCLPTFPLNSSYKLRVGCRVARGPLKVRDISTTAMAGKWNSTVAEGFSDATIDYESGRNGEVQLDIYFMDPAIAVSDIVVDCIGRNKSLAETLLTNADFEYNVDGVHKASRGLPEGWKMYGSVSGTYGINADMVGQHGDYGCWVHSTPFPSEFKLYQTIPASKLQPGVYRVSCLLWCQNGKAGNCRLYANNSVNYYASALGAYSMKEDDEYSTFASHQGTTASYCRLLPMYVNVVINQGDSLEVGIKTSNRKGNGGSATGNDPQGWFKVDNFLIEKLSDLPTGISTVNRTAHDGKNYVYNLKGQRMDSNIENLPSGIYIVNGRKVVKK